MQTHFILLLCWMEIVWPQRRWTESKREREELVLLHTESNQAIIVIHRFLWTTTHTWCRKLCEIKIMRIKFVIVCLLNRYRMHSLIFSNRYHAVVICFSMSFHSFSFVIGWRNWTENWSKYLTKDNNWHRTCEHYPQFLHAWYALNLNTVC
jgi:hypothetical protein